MNTPINVGKRSKHYLPVRELGPLLATHFGVEPGAYNLAVEFEMAATHLGPSPSDRTPGIAARLTGVGLEPASERGPMTFDVVAPTPTAE